MDFRSHFPGTCIYFLKAGSPHLVKSLFFHSVMLITCASLILFFLFHFCICYALGSRDPIPSFVCYGGRRLYVSADGDRFFEATVQGCGLRDCPAW